jgi:hypothetical protein
VNPLDPPAQGLFFALSKIRGKRSFHPDGAGFRATLAVTDEGAQVVRAGVLGGSGTHEAIARLSKGAGMPGALPDILGLAIRVPDAYGSGAHQDLLLVTSATLPVLRHTILPAPRGFFGHFYSSVAPFDANGSLLVFGARSTETDPSPSSVGDLTPAAPGRKFIIVAAAPRGSWVDVATLELGEHLPHGTVESMRFNPWNTSDDLEPRGPFMRLRDPAYRASQAGRGEGAL